MLDRHFRSIISNHPGKTVALYKGATVNGIFDVASERLYSENATFIYNTTYTFTCLTSELPQITDTKNIPIKINDKNYTIHKVVPESTVITTLDLEVSK